jgi:hypothetical protein
MTYRETLQAVMNIQNGVNFYLAKNLTDFFAILR